MSESCEIHGSENNDINCKRCWAAFNRIVSKNNVYVTGP